MVVLVVGFLCVFMVSVVFIMLFILFNVVRGRVLIKGGK